MNTTKLKATGQLTIGRTLCRASTVPAKNKAYYKEHIIAGKHPFYAIVPRKGRKAEWVRKLYSEHFVPLIQLLKFRIFDTWEGCVATLGQRDFLNRC